MPTQTIELDCPPGTPRPGDLLPGVLEDTGIPVREPVSKLFGCWKWDYSDIPQDIWNGVLPTIRMRITRLYNDGIIRYGSW